MLEWVSFAIALCALGVSIWTHLDTRPRLKVSQSTPLVLYPQDHGQWPGARRPLVVVEITNEGSQPAQISRIRLGGDHQGLMLPAVPEGPDFPHTVGPRGGRTSWQFDYARIRQTVETNYHGGQVTLQAEVFIGRKKIKARPVSKVQELSPTRETVRPPETKSARRGRQLAVMWGQRIAWLYRWAKRPMLISSSPWISIDDSTLNRGYIEHHFHVNGHWPVPAHRLVLVAHVPTGDGWPRMERKLDLEPVRVPLTWPWQVRSVRLPLVTSSHTEQTGTQFWWHPEPRKWYQGSLGANTVAEVQTAKSETSSSANSPPPKFGPQDSQLPPTMGVEFWDCLRKLQGSPSLKPQILRRIPFARDRALPGSEIPRD